MCACVILPWFWVCLIFHHLICTLSLSTERQDCCTQDLSRKKPTKIEKEKKKYGLRKEKSHQYWWDCWKLTIGICFLIGSAYRGFCAMNLITILLCCYLSQEGTCWVEDTALFQHRPGKTWRILCNWDSSMGWYWYYTRWLAL